MINIVHGQQIFNCQWTGEPIIKGERFRFPNKGLRKWVGCYGSPSCAMAALQKYCDEEAISKEEHTELFQQLQSSLRRKDGTESVKFTIVAAPNYNLLEFWGGSMTLAEFHKIYGHDEQLKLYNQAIPSSMDDVTTVRMPKNTPKPWWLSAIDPRGSKAGLTPVTVGIPRSVKTWLAFLKDSNPKKEGCSHCVVVYFHPKDHRLFAVGSPLDWNEVPNKKAGDMFENMPVFGCLNVFHKNVVKEKQKVTKQAKQQAKQQNADAPSTSKQDEELAHLVEEITSSQKTTKEQQASAPPPAKKRKFSVPGLC